MACVDTLPGTHNETSALERVRYFPRQLLTADDLRLEQEYFREKQRRHNRFLHGWGVVCGLEVRADPASGPLVVRICPGYALGPQGDEIYVASSATLDLYGCLRPPADPCQPVSVSAAVSASAASATTLAVQIRYAEYPSRPVRTLPAGCGCDDSACEYSRLRDGFEMRCVLHTPAKPPTSVEPTLCQIHKGGGLAACLPPSDQCWLDLALVVVKKPAAGSSGAMAIDDGMIDNRVRRIVVSTATLQAQVIECCC